MSAASYRAAVQAYKGVHQAVHSAYDHGWGWCKGSMGKQQQRGLGKGMRDCSTGLGERKRGEACGSGKTLGGYAAGADTGKDRVWEGGGRLSAGGGAVGVGCDGARAGMEKLGAKAAAGGPGSEGEGVAGGGAEGGGGGGVP